jgi:hypothetical protein
MDKVLYALKSGPVMVVVQGREVWQGGSGVWFNIESVLKRQRNIDGKLLDKTSSKENTACLDRPLCRDIHRVRFTRGEDQEGRRVDQQLTSTHDPSHFARDHCLYR